MDIIAKRETWSHDGEKAVFIELEDHTVILKRMFVTSQKWRQSKHESMEAAEKFWNSKVKKRAAGF